MSASRAETSPSPPLVCSLPSNNRQAALRLLSRPRIGWAHAWRSLCRPQQLRGCDTHGTPLFPIPVSASISIFPPVPSPPSFTLLVIRCTWAALTGTHYIGARCLVAARPHGCWCSGGSPPCSQLLPRQSTQPWTMGMSGYPEKTGGQHKIPIHDPPPLTHPSIRSICSTCLVLS